MRIFKTVKIDAGGDGSIYSYANDGLMLFVTRNVTCDQVIYRHFRTLIHKKFTENLQKMVF